MVKGIVSGLIWGGVTGSAVVSVLSLYAPLPEPSKAAMEQVQTPKPVEEAPVVPEPQAKAEPVPDDQPTEDAVADVPSVKVEPEVIADAEAEPLVTSEDVDAPAVEAPADVVADVVIEEPAPEAQVNAPQTASNQTTSQEGLQTALPDTDDAVASLPTSTLSVDEAEAPIAELDVPQTPVRPSTVADAPTAPATSTAPKLASLRDGAAPSAANPGGLSLPQVDTAPAASGETAPRVAVVAPETDIETVQPTPVASDTPIKLPVPNIENPVAGVVTNRLPSVTAPEPEAAVSTEESAVTDEPVVTEVAVDANAVGALVAYAAAFEGEVSDALFSIILIDDGTTGVPRAELVGLDVPFSIAIDPSAPNAAAIAADYRAAGIEVLAMLGDLPSSAEPSDVAVAVEGYFNVLNEAIAVLDPLDGRIQSNRSLLQPVLGAIRDTGHGLVTYDRGLNTAQQAARREGIAAATVFRVLDADLEESPKIKRYLGRAAFNASKDGAVVVVGHSRHETVKAILEWALDEKGGDLSIVPVSRIMQQDLG